MQRRKRRARFVCVLLLLCTLTLCLQEPAFAQVYRTSASKKLSTMYYSQLSTREQSAYKLLVRSNLRHKTVVRWYVSATIKVSQEALQNHTWLNSKEIKKLEKEFQSAYYAYRLDYMDECYWLSENVEALTFRESHEAPKGDGPVSMKLQYITFEVQPAYAAALSDDNAVQKALGKMYTYAKANRQNTSRQATVLAIADVMARYMSLYKPSSPLVESTPSSVLLKKYGMRGNPEAYARTFFCLCKRFDIPVVYIQAALKHNYCYVQMENGIWYGVDVSWADRGDWLDKNWILYGTSTAKKYDLSDAHSPLKQKNGISFSAISISKKSYTK